MEEIMARKARERNTPTEVIYLPTSEYFALILKRNLEFGCMFDGELHQRMIAF
jgi:hypothetical protein